MTAATIHQLIAQLDQAFGALSVVVTPSQLEHMANLVHRSMESPRRRYHRAAHALQLCEGMRPRQVLAAVFHDLVYVQLDDGFPELASHWLAPLVRPHGQDLVLQAVAADDSAMQLCHAMFGFEAGQALPLFRGLNEFLSAAVAVRLLHPLLSPPDLVAVLACIEATIPFRAPLPDGRSCALMLADRVRDLARRHLAMTDSQTLEDFVSAVMDEAVTLANRDVGGFAEPDPARFVQATWQLIEESNAPLAAVGVYTLQDFREALTRMQLFLEWLLPERVFQRYGHAPLHAEFDRLRAAAAGNIAFALKFLQLKILSISIIEALALETGGNCPVALLLGDLRAVPDRAQRVEDYLPPGPQRSGLDAQLLQVLEYTPEGDAPHTLTLSPLSAYTYRCLGEAGCQQAQAAAERMVEGELSARAFLLGLDPELLNNTIDACARIAVSRRTRLLALKVPA